MFVLSLNFIAIFTVFLYPTKLTVKITIFLYKYLSEKKKLHHSTIHENQQDNMSRSEAGTIVSATDNEVKSINKETNKSLSQNTILITLPNDSSTSSSPTNLELNEISNNYDSYQNLYRFQPNSESSTPTTFTTLTSRRPSSRNSQSVYSNSKRTNSASTYGMRRALLTGPILYENTAGESLHNDIDGLSGICYDCGSNSYLTKSGDTQLCENCIHKRWQTEISELIKVKTYLENSVDELKKYLAAKKSQCNENIRNSQQIKRFINMTMQQIKRKVELELENKRDELYHSIDNFVDSQKKYSCLAFKFRILITVEKVFFLKNKFVSK